MIYVAILTASLFLLVAFAVERLDRASGLPSVVVMIALGIIAKPALRSMGVLVEGLEAVVPVAGAVGLVLIVLEGALDIELRRERLRIAGKAFLFAAGALLIYGILFSAVAVRFLKLTLFQGALLAVPFTLISSAIAIPGSHSLNPHEREFIVYESSVSDILGVLVFFALLHSHSTLKGFLTTLGGGGLLSLLLAIACSTVLVFISTRATAHVRFVPLLASLFALYSIGELLHLSPLIMVLLFGLMLNNRSVLKRIPSLSALAGRLSTATVEEFKVLVRELTFAVRGFFFFLLGYSTSLSDFALARSWIVAAAILLLIYVGRFIALRQFDRPLAASVTWIAPRGLITVLLYLEARRVLRPPAYLDGTVLLVVFVSAALMALSRRRRTRTA